MNRSEVFLLVSDARDKADEKWGRNSGNLGPWLANPHLGATILMEEVGEISRAILEQDEEGLKAELLDVAQVVVAWLESM